MAGVGVMFGGQCGWDEEFYLFLAKRGGHLFFDRLVSFQTPPAHHVLVERSDEDKDVVSSLGKCAD